MKRFKELELGDKCSVIITGVSVICMIIITIYNLWVPIVELFDKMVNKLNSFRDKLKFKKNFFKVK